MASSPDSRSAGPRRQAGSLRRVLEMHRRVAVSFAAVLLVVAGGLFLLFPAAFAFAEGAARSAFRASRPPMRPLFSACSLIDLAPVRGFWADYPLYR